MPDMRAATMTRRCPACGLVLHVGSARAHVGGARCLQQVGKMGLADPVRGRRALDVAAELDALLSTSEGA